MEFRERDSVAEYERNVAASHKCDPLGDLSAFRGRL